MNHGFKLAALCLCAVALCFASACTKKIDGTSMDKFYVSSSEVMAALSESEQKEFSDGLELILFFAQDTNAAIAEMNGKTADEVFAQIQELRDKLPTIDASRREKYASSLSDVLKSIRSDGTRQILQSYMVRYGFFPWNNKNMNNIRTLDGKNAFEINKAIDDIRKDEDPTQINKK